MLPVLNVMPLCLSGELVSCHLHKRYSNPISYLLLPDDFPVSQLPRRLAEELVRPKGPLREKESEDSEGKNDVQTSDSAYDTILKIAAVPFHCSCCFLLICPFACYCINVTKVIVSRRSTTSQMEMVMLTTKPARNCIENVLDKFAHICSILRILRAHCIFRL